MNCKDTKCNHSVILQYLIVFVVLFAPSVLCAVFADKAHAHHGIASLQWYYVNAAIFFYFLFVILRKPVIKFFASRRDTIKNRVDEANKIYNDALNAFNSAKEKHENLETELQKIYDNIIFEAKEQAEHIELVAEKKASYLKETAKQMIDAEEKKAIKNLNVAFSKMLVENVTNDIKSSLNNELDDKLINSGIEKISNESLS